MWTAECNKDCTGIFDPLKVIKVFRKSDPGIVRKIKVAIS